MKVVFVSGSSRGIGAAVARKAHALGYTVVLHGRTESDSLKSLAKELDADYYVFDVSNSAAAHKALKTCIEKYGTMHSLINCAGVVRPKPIVEIEDADWAAEIGTNIQGVFSLVQIFAQQNAENLSVVNVASIRGVSTMASSRGIIYSATKAAVINMTAAFAKEFAPRIRVNAVAPGFTETDMAKTWNDTVRAQAASALLGRAAKPEEIANAIMFLAGDEASYITGQTLLVDGGYQMAGK